MYPKRIVIIGGGPAGCAAAILLARQGVDVTVVERTAYDNVRVGETLPPQMNGLLSRLGVWEAFRALNPLPFTHISSAWAQEQLHEEDLMFQPHGRGWHIRRARFDKMLAEAASSARARLLINATAQSFRILRNNSWEIHVMNALGQKLKLSADFVIDATGSSRRVGRWLCMPLVDDDTQVALIAYVRPESVISATTDTSLCIETVEEGWLYTCPVDRDFRVVALISNRSLVRNLREPRDILANALRSGHYVSEQLTDCRLPEKVIARPVLSQKTARCYGDNWVAIGDAAMVYDPLTGMGLTKAVTDGIKVAELLIDSIAQQQTVNFAAYNKQQAAAFWQYRKRRCAYYQMEQRWADRSFWREMHTLCSTGKV